MVSVAKYFRADPNRKGRGEGWYYHRGNKVYSKLTPELDRAIEAKTKLPRGDYHRREHMGDRKTRGRMRWL
jgi:hypothetical protein